MQDLLYQFGSSNDMTTKDYYISVHPTLVAKVAYDKIAIMHVSLEDMSLTSIHQNIDGVINDASNSRKLENTLNTMDRFINQKVLGYKYQTPPLKKKACEGSCCKNQYRIQKR